MGTSHRKESTKAQEQEESREFLKSQNQNNCNQMLVMIYTIVTMHLSLTFFFSLHCYGPFYTFGSEYLQICLNPYRTILC